MGCGSSSDASGSQQRQQNANFSQNHHPTPAKGMADVSNARQTPTQAQAQAKQVAHQFDGSAAAAKNLQQQKPQQNAIVKSPQQINAAAKATTPQRSNSTKSALAKRDSMKGSKKQELSVSAKDEPRKKSGGRMSEIILQKIKPNSEVGEMLRSVPLFAHLDKNERETLGGALEIRNYKDGQFVFKEGDPGDCFYIIKSGAALVTKADEDGKEMMLAQLGQDDYFGEQAIITGDIRHANVRALDGELSLYELNKDKFSALFKKERLDITFTQRRRVAVAGDRDNDDTKSQRSRPTVDMTDEQLRLVTKAVQKSLLFQNLDPEHKEQVARMMVQQEFKKGTKIITEGEDGNQFYIIETGEVDVFQRNEKTGEDILVDNHGPGGSFGELALMYDAPRNATCVAVVNCTCRVLERKHFNHLVKQLAKLRTQQYADWLSQVVILKPLTRQERYDLAETMELLEYEQGEVLFREGDVGDSMYLVVSGEVYFSTMDKKTGEEKKVEGPHGTQTAGGYFGEKALMYDTPRSLTVTASTLTRLLRIDRSAFEQIFGSMEELLKEKEKDYAKSAKADEGEGGATNDDDFKWEPVPVKFEDLEDVGVLGKGSYGYVKLVRDSQDKKEKKLYALKAISKQRIVETHQKGHLFNEKNLMMMMNHPFITRLYRTYQDKDLLYFLLEPSLGGELFRILRKAKVFPYEQARFYAGAVVLAFEYMHNKSLLYRDLKPENLLIDSKGYLKVTDFGFCKKVAHKTWTMCGTPEYMCPEIIQTQGHGKGADWWTVGIFIFEMLASFTPFYGQGGVMKMYDRICSGKFKFPSHFNKPAKDIISGLLNPKAALRFGVVKGGPDLIKQHAWFEGLNWDDLFHTRLAAPFVPSKETVENLSNFNQRVTNDFAPYIDDGTDWDKDF